jgi:hypothetical protein
MEPVADEEGDGSVGANFGAAPEVLPGGRPSGLSVYESSFPARVAAFLPGYLSSWPPAKPMPRWGSRPAGPEARYST